MPQSLKAVSSITAWVLFFAGWIGVLFAVAGIISIITELFAIPNVTLLMLTGAFAAGVVCFVLSACTIKLRQMLE